MAKEDGWKDKPINGNLNHLLALAPSIIVPCSDVKNSIIIIIGIPIIDSPLKYLYGIRCVKNIIKKPTKTIETCLIKLENIRSFPKFELAL